MDQPPSYNETMGQDYYKQTTGAQYPVPQYTQGYGHPPPPHQQPQVFYTGQAAYYPPAPAPMPVGHQPTPPVAYNNNNNSNNNIEGNFAASGFSDKNIRHAFIRKVYLILTFQLSITVAIVVLFQFVQPIKIYIMRNLWIYLLSYGIFIAVYLCLICCASVRRKYPGNYIALFIFTLALSFMTGTIACFHDTPAVLCALGITACLCVGLTIFAIQTKIDFTMCSGLLFALTLVLFLFGLAMIIVWRVDGTSARILQCVYGGLGALVFSLFLVFDTQLIVGGRKHELSEEEYISGALQLYLDVVMIFMFIMSLFGGGNN